MRGAVVLLAAALLILLAARCAADDHEDPEVTAYKQQCARQRAFAAAERRYCVARCDEYGRMKKREQQEEEKEKERDRCLHKCRAGPRKPGYERRYIEEYERDGQRETGRQFVPGGRTQCAWADEA